MFCILVSKRDYNSFNTFYYRECCVHLYTLSYTIVFSTDTCKLVVAQLLHTKDVRFRQNAL